MAERRRLTLRMVAECFEVEVHWIEQVYELGLLQPDRRRELPVEQLERVARIVRLYRLGVNLEGIAILLGR